MHWKEGRNVWTLTHWLLKCRFCHGHEDSWGRFSLSHSGILMIGLFGSVSGTQRNEADTNAEWRWHRGALRMCLHSLKCQHCYAGTAPTSSSSRYYNAACASGNMRKGLPLANSTCLLYISFLSAIVEDLKEVFDCAQGLNTDIFLNFLQTSFLSLWVFESCPS